MSGNIEFARAQLSALLEARGDDPLLDVLVEVDSLEVAAQHVAGAQLADAEVLRGLRLLERGEGPDLAALYLQSNAPLRQT